MEKYNYYEAVYDDVKSYIEENIDEFFNANYDCEYDDDSLYEFLEERLWAVDCVTGNGSGSYTFNTWAAEENLCHNLDLLTEALDEFGYPTNILEKGAEWCDVTIRCYLLAGELKEYLDSDEFQELWEEKKKDYITGLAMEGD